MTNIINKKINEIKKIFLKENKIGSINCIYYVNQSIFYNNIKQK